MVLLKNYIHSFLCVCVLLRVLCVTDFPSGGRDIQSIQAGAKGYPPDEIDPQVIDDLLWTTRVFLQILKTFIQMYSGTSFSGHSE